MPTFVASRSHVGVLDGTARHTSRRRPVHVSSINEVPAGGDEALEHHTAGLLVRLSPKGHGPQAEVRDEQAGLSEVAVLQAAGRGAYLTNAWSCCCIPGSTLFALVPRRISLTP